MATDVVNRDSTEIHRALDALRNRIRRYVCTAGLAWLLAAAAVLVWVSLGTDWLFEPPRGMRALLAISLLATLGWLALKWVVLPVAARIGRHSLALVLERRFPRLGDRLVTAVDLSKAADNPDQPYHSHMLAATRAEAARLLMALDLDQVFNPAPLVHSVLVSAALLLSVAAVALAKPEIFETWCRRAWLLSGELYPRRTRLAVAGFDDGRVKVARGADFQVVALADTQKVVPETVRIQYEAAGVRDRAAMDREGNARSGREPFQKYSYTFHVLSPVEFDLIGGDDRVNDLRIDMVEVPTVDVGQTWLSCEFPEYLGRLPAKVPITANISLPHGTEVSIHGTSTKPLVSVSVANAGDNNSGGTPSSPSTPGGRQFDLPLGRIDHEQVFLFVLTDTDAIQSRDPWRLALSAIPDEPPQLAVRLKGIGSAITPEARLPLVGPLKDDYGLARVWLEYAVGDNAAATRELATPVAGRSEVAVSEAIEATDLKVAPRQELRLQIKAQDNCGLDSGPQQSAGEQLSLAVVTGEELRAMLESRELNLRRRFEQLLGEVTDTRDSLAGLKFDPASDKTPAAESLGEASGEQRLSESPVDSTRLAIERSIQNSRKNADETLGVAVAFDDIHEELVNNRVDTEELKSRLKQDIAEPLHRLAAAEFPELDRRLTGVQAALAIGPGAATAALPPAREQLDKILVEMQQVLDKMMTMETFNELVDLLRSIVDDQGKLNDETKKARRASVRDLLED